MNVAVTGIGLATAQGNTADILASRAPRPPSELPWTPDNWNVSRICCPAIDSSLAGVARWRALIENALADLGAPNKTPLLLASCNGSAAENWEDAFETPWRDKRVPVFSSSCASGIHALYAARELLTSGALDEVVVLAADILAPSNHQNFEGLRVLAEKPCAPWQSTSSGFILGEAAVALRLARATGESEIVLRGPALGSDLPDHDVMRDLIDAVPADVGLIVGQGTGPFANDASELATFAASVDKRVPVATPLRHFGHTLGASGLLAIALGLLAHRRVAALKSEATETMDGRPLLNGAVGGDVLVTCKALNGACAATIVGEISHAKTQRRKGSWRKGVTPSGLMTQTARRVAAEASEHKPADVPDVLMIRLEKPLSPPASAVIGGRLLPSAVLEITPGFVSQLIARCWGFSGPALCLAGDVDVDPYGLTNALRESGANVFQVKLRGNGDDRAIEWNV